MLRDFLMYKPAVIGKNLIKISFYNVDFLPIKWYTLNRGGIMNYRSVKETALRWNTSERSVRNYCAAGRVEGAVLIGKTWSIPENAQKPERSNKRKPAPAPCLMF